MRISLNRHLVKAAVLISLLSVPVLPVLGEEARFRSVNDIVGKLNPLDVIANHGGVRRSIDLNIRFALGSASLLPAADRQVNALAEALASQRLQGYTIQLHGHTDASGSEVDNLRLSLRRAEAVQGRLIEHYGIEPQRLSAEGKGESDLLPGLAETSPQHRRVEIIAIAVNQASHSQHHQMPLGVGGSANDEREVGDQQDNKNDGEQTIVW